MVVDVDPKAKAWEDYDMATGTLLEILGVEGYKAQSQHGESIAV